MELFSDKGPYSGRWQIDFGLSPGDKVVDIGGATRTFPPSTHVIDLLDNSKERYGCGLEIGNRIFMAGDVCDVLKGVEDDYFDFCYSAHTFEHIEDLPAALELISRKCKRGYYAFPGYEFELMQSQRKFGHKWLCEIVGGVLRIVRRPQNTVFEEMGKAMEIIMANPRFKNVWEGHGCRGFRFLWEIRHYWEGHIEYEVFSDPVELFPQLAYME